MKINTTLAQIGNRRDSTGAISFPVYYSATFGHPALGAVQALSLKGIKPYVLPDFIEDALKSFFQTK